MAVLSLLMAMVEVIMEEPQHTIIVFMFILLLASKF